MAFNPNKTSGKRKKELLKQIAEKHPQLSKAQQFNMMLHKIKNEQESK